MTPPSVGPMLIPRPTTKALSPSARPRCSAGNAATNMAVLTAITKAAPTPCKHRHPTSQRKDEADPHKAELTVKTASPAAQDLARPKVSDKRPAVSSSA